MSETRPPQGSPILAGLGGPGNVQAYPNSENRGIDLVGVGAGADARPEASQYDAATILTPETVAAIRQVMERYPVARSAVMPALYLAQAQIGWLPPAALAAVGAVICIPAADVEETASFYNMYYRRPVGRKIVKVCTSISCFLCGADEVMARFERELGIRAGETTPDGAVTLLRGECLADCHHAPAGQLNDEYLGRLTPDVVDRVLEEVRSDNGSL